jgi:hypothetical protein
MRGRQQGPVPAAPGNVCPGTLGFCPLFLRARMILSRGFGIWSIIHSPSYGRVQDLIPRELYSTGGVLRYSENKKLYENMHLRIQMRQRVSNEETKDSNFSDPRD